MISISRATGGRIPLSALSNTTEGRLFAGIAQGGGSGDGSERRKPVRKRPHGNFIFTPQDIRSANEIVTEIKDGNELEIERPKHINKTVYLLPDAKPISDIDAKDQELVSLIRLDEIKRHAELERIFAEEEMKFTEELSVFLLLLED
tara:strand:+ start:3424 stop:3864 length:441 start_codon:yes stop_codon:yes gene_type:complete